MAQGEGGGRPTHKPTDETRKLVKEFIAFGIGQHHICRRLGISDETLRKYYDYEIENGLSDMIHVVANKLYQKAVDQDDLGAQIFILKTRARWREKEPEDATKALSIIEQLIKSKNKK